MLPCYILREQQIGQDITTRYLIYISKPLTHSFLLKKKKKKKVYVIHICKKKKKKLRYDNNFNY